MTKKPTHPTPEIAHLLDTIDRYKSAAGDLTDKTASYRIFRDAKKIGLLRAGGDITTGNYHAALKWIADNWPRGIERPTSPPPPRPGKPRITRGAA